MLSVSVGPTVLYESAESNQFAYYEYKYLVPHGILHNVFEMLEELYGGSDPFPDGVVDSIYYDTQDEFFLSECVNGNANKVKFRIRGYGGDFQQVHQKIKHMSTVSKHKSSIVRISSNGSFAPDWQQLQPRILGDPEFFIIQQYSERAGPLFPSIRVRYHRFRYRTYDYRITLDTNIEVSSLTNGLPRLVFNANLPDHVLEIKTMQLRPKLPFIGLIKLSPVSFSKFMLGLQLLND